MQVIIDEPFQPFAREINYTLEVLTEEFLLIPTDIEILIYYGNHALDKNSRNACVLQIIPADFFNANTYLTYESLPEEPLSWVNADDLNVADKNKFESKIPLLYAQKINPPKLVEYKERYIVVHIDLIACVFFMLTRYEEQVLDKRDRYRRFPIEESLAFKAGFYHRPVVNEYVELMRDWLNRLYPALGKNPHEFTVRLTHDVDQFRKFESLLKEIIRIPYEIGVRGGKSSPALKRFNECREVFAGVKADPYNTFEQLMDISEDNGVRSTFYFMTHADRCGYRIADRRVRKTMERILTRGHEIGLHPTLGTSDSHEKLAVQKECLDTILGYTDYGARQHFLQWKASDTWRIYEKTGLTHDSTLGHTELPGFRCGTCYPYTVFDLKERRKLALTERPLIVMDASVYSIKYETMRRKYFEKAFDFSSRPGNINDYVFFLKRQVQKYDGCFSILWHNDRFASSPVLDYTQLIRHFHFNANGVRKID